METHSKNTGFGGLSRRRCLAIWNSAAWRASKGGKSENSIAWEAVTAGKSENSLAWEAPTRGKSENSLAWGAPTGGKSENSLAWGALTGGKNENSLAWGAPTGGESENSLAWGAPTGGKSEHSLAWGAPTGGEVKILSLGSPHGGKPPLAPLTDRNKPAVWAATPREAGWICSLSSVKRSLDRSINWDCLQIACRLPAETMPAVLSGPSWSLVPSGRPRPIGLPVHPLVSKWHRDTVSRWRLKRRSTDQQQINIQQLQQLQQRHSSNRCRCQDEYEDRLRNLSRRDLTRCVTYADRVIQYIQVSVAISTQIWPGAKHTVLPKNMHWHIVLY